VPTLIMTGDEDEPCLEPALFMKRTIPTAGLLVLPKSGHTINLEEPDAFNRAVLDFVTTVDAGRWMRRNPASLSPSAVLQADSDS
jgi:pimeloyl-ACP methyl ester carboxylesterase